MKYLLYLILLITPFYGYAQGPSPIAAPAAISTWMSAKSYSIGQVAIQYGITYQSLANSNAGNSPVSSPSFWSTTITGGGGGSGSQRVIYASSITGVTTGVAVVPGSSASGTTNSAAAINTAIAGGNVDLEVDSGFALATSLVLASNTTIHCVAPQYGFIMQTAANLPVIVNANPNAPTTTSGTGGYIVSNQTDKNISVVGCQLNNNSTQSVTGTQSGIAHKYNPATGLWVVGVQFIGVNGITFRDNTIYDPGTYAFMGSNDSQLYFQNNTCLLPQPITASKNTACFQVVGPDTLLWVQNNRMQCGDDCLALNADDGNRTGTGDPNSSFGSWPGTKWGTLNHAHLDSNVFDNAYYGIRLLSATELIDDIEVTNTTGNLCGNTFTMDAAYPSIGNGNIGTVYVNGWNVPTSGTCNTFGLPYNFWITENYQTISLDNIHLTPTVNWPIITQNSVTPGLLSLRNFDIQSTGVSTFNPVVFSGTAPTVAASAIQWNDNSVNTGAFFSGSTVPSLTCSNYVGPNRLLASGFVPAVQNGDCFSNTYLAAASVYINTTFNEHTVGTNLVGTAPATNTPGGNWTAAASAPTTNWQYNTNLITLTGPCTGTPHNGYCPMYISTGHANYTARFTPVSWQSIGNFAIVLRWTDANNFVTVQYQPGSTQWAMYDVVGGTNNLIGTVSGSLSAGAYSLAISGNAITFTPPTGAVLSGTVSSSNTPQNFGFGDYGPTFGSGSDNISSFSVKSF